MIRKPSKRKMKCVKKLCDKCGKELKHKCPDCGLMVCGSCSHGNNNSCLMVLGRRGWRELGVYDG